MEFCEIYRKIGFYPVINEIPISPSALTVNSFDLQMLQR